MGQFVYSFNEGSKDMKSLLGGKGANLAEMTKIGLPVPFGFTVTTEACNKYYADGKKMSKEVIDQTFEKLAELENVISKKFGDPTNPLLVSVRSGAVFSMPGMMDTILNLGLNDETVEGMSKLTGNERFAFDSYRRFIQMFGDVVLDISKSKFDEIFDAKKEEKGYEVDIDLKSDDLKAIIASYKALIKKEVGRDFPQDPKEQLMEAIMAVFRSWNNERAVLYRQLNNIPSSLGTAVNVQSMVFGNMGDTSGTGVAFTRNPATGENKIFGEFLVNAQGEDVVAGIRTPLPIDEMAVKFESVYKDFVKIAELLEKHYTDMQDMEFTIENNKLFMLQTRSGKRTAAAAVKVAVDMEKEGLIDRKTAITRIDPAQIDQLLHPTFDPIEIKKAVKLAKGLAASPGASYGKVYFNAASAEVAAATGEKVILVRLETSPEDLAGMVAAEGILTARGGMTSHAAVVARGMGKCCVSGCTGIKVNEKEKLFEAGGRIFKEGAYISLDGSTGDVYEGLVKTVKAELSGDFNTIMKWADEVRVLKVRANADNPKDAQQAIEFGAEGIGLCRTEHMFFNEERIPAVRRMILADSEVERREALAFLLPYQKEDFKGIYEIMGDRPVTIRLLDPPLHEFLPHTDEEIEILSKQINVPFEKLKKKTLDLHEFNPMLGHRGCRLAVTYPEIAEMQAEAIITAAIELKKEKGMEIIPEIMIPLIGLEKELAFVKNTVVDTINRCFEKQGVKVEYLVGTMIEVPRAALTADEIAKEAEFFSFGTNDLTQMTFGFSRDDTNEIINQYRELLIFEEDPFQTIDVAGVGKLVEMSVKLGRQTRPTIKLGICGEHGGDPKTVELCHNIGLNYVSCSPFRVPIARLAAAQAVVKAEGNNHTADK
ncbi:MAG: pyruvate, phosphate dikinase [Eubacteriales bacterium]|nr:pyruvate, phosphate dikinase [Eubacteriales bacterium]